MKKIIPYLLLVVISLAVTTKAHLAYQTFTENNVPVYDGVMYEQRQIQTFQRFKGNFSLMERLNQVIYEFRGKPITAGFECTVALINPQWFVNDWDILIRAFLTVLIFTAVLFKYLKLRTSPLNALFIIVLFFQLPLFYNFRYGLSSYIPEIISALWLLAGYFQTLIFFKSEKIQHFLIACVLMITAIMFRFNFFVYTAFLLLPLSYKAIVILWKKPLKTKLIACAFTLTALAFVAFYVVSHLEFFLNYYASDIEYAAISLQTSIRSFTINLTMQAGVLGLLSLLIISLFANENPVYSKAERWQVFYPGAFFLIFIILFMNATNTPHVYAMVIVFMLTLFLTPSNYLQKLTKKINPNVLRGTAGILFLLLNYNFILDYQKFSETEVQYAAQKEIIQEIIDDPQLEQLRKNYKYISFLDVMVEIPMDVTIYRKSKIWLNSSDHFYTVDWNYQSIAPSLTIEDISNHYLDKIKQAKFNLIAINKDRSLVWGDNYKATEVVKVIQEHLKNDPNYFVDKEIEDPHYGQVLLYKKKRGDSTNSGLSIMEN